MSAAATPPAGLPEFGGLTVAQAVIVLRTIASAAATLRQFAVCASDSGDEEAMGAALDVVQRMAAQIGGMADEASGSQCLGSLMHWLCGTAFDDAGAKGLQHERRPTRS